MLRLQGELGVPISPYVDIVYYHVVSQNLSSGSSFFFFFHFLHLFLQLVTVKTLLNNVRGIPAESSTGENSHLPQCACTLSLAGIIFGSNQFIPSCQHNFSSTSFHTQADERINKRRRRRRRNI